MQFAKLASAIPCALGLLTVPACNAQEEPPVKQFIIGAKAWNAAWSSYLPAYYTVVGTNAQPPLADVVNAVEGTRTTSIMPQLSARYDKYLVSVSYGRYTSDFSVLNSPLPTPNGTVATTRTDHFLRHESDVAFGYYILPQIALSISYKYAIESRDTRSGTETQATPFVENKARALLLGVVGAFPVQGGLSAYVQAAYGPARIKTRSFPPPAVQIDANGRYLIGEIGLSYPFWRDRNGGSSANVSIGYRTQTVKTYSYGTLYHERRDLRDVREGLVLTLNFVL